MKNNLNQNSEQLSQKKIDWNIIQDNMREKFGEDIFQSWLKKISFVDEFNNYILISVSTRFIRDSDDMPAYQAMALTKEQTPNAAYKAIQHNPEFSEVLQSIPFRHPAQLYEGFCYVFVFIALYLLYWKTDWKNKPGFLFGLFMVLLFVVRFFVEFYKKSQGGFEDTLGMLSTGQWLSIPMILIGVYFMVKPEPVEL